MKKGSVGVNNGSADAIQFTDDVIIDDNEAVICLNEAMRGRHGGVPGGIGAMRCGGEAIKDMGGSVERWVKARLLTGP